MQPSLPAPLRTLRVSMTSSRTLTINLGSSPKMVSMRSISILFSLSLFVCFILSLIALPSSRIFGSSLNAFSSIATKTYLESLLHDSGIRREVGEKQILVSHEVRFSWLILKYKMNFASDYFFSHQSINQSIL